MRIRLTVGLLVAVAAVWTFAGPVVSSGAWSLEQVSGGISAVGIGEGEHLPGGVGVGPGATEPAPVDKLVPSLADESLAAARRSLHAAHCTLGKVSRSHGRRGALVVRSQSPGHGRMLASEAAVEVRLGLATRRRG